MNLSGYLDPLLVRRLQHLQLPARRLADGGASGRYRSHLHGASVEFRQHRFYSPGDDPRALDWRILARTDRPFIRQFQQDTNLRCQILLDSSASMNYGGKFDHAVSLASALAYLLLQNGEHVGLAAFSGKIERWIPARGSIAQLSRLIDAMEKSSPKMQTIGTFSAVHQACERLSRRSLVLILSDLFYRLPEVTSALAHLHHKRHEIILLRVLHRDEIEFPFRSPLVLRHLELSQNKFVDPAIARRVYLDNFAEHERQLQSICRLHHAELETFVADEPLTDALPRFLHRRLKTI